MTEWCLSSLKQFKQEYISEGFINVGLNISLDKPLKEQLTNNLLQIDTIKTQLETLIFNHNKKFSYNDKDASDFKENLEKSDKISSYEFSESMKNFVQKISIQISINQTQNIELIYPELCQNNSDSESEEQDDYEESKEQTQDKIINEKTNLVIIKEQKIIDETTNFYEQKHYSIPIRSKFYQEYNSQLKEKSVIPKTKEKSKKKKNVQEKTQFTQISITQFFQKE